MHSRTTQPQHPHSKTALINKETQLHTLQQREHLILLPFVQEIEGGVAHKAGNKEQRAETNLVPQLRGRRLRRSGRHEQRAQNVAKTATERLVHTEHRIRHRLLVLEVPADNRETLGVRAARRRNEGLEPGVGDGEEQIEEKEDPVLPAVGPVGEEESGDAGNDVEHQHGEQTDGVDAPAVNEAAHHLSDGVDDHEQRNVGLVVDLPVVHAVHEDRLEAKAEEERRQTRHPRCARHLQHGSDLLQHVLALPLHNHFLAVAVERRLRTEEDDGAEDADC